MRTVYRCGFAVTCVTSLFAQPDPRAIVRRSVLADNRNEAIRHNYTYRVLTVARDLDSAGNVKATHTSLADVLYIGSHTYRQPIEKDGKPLPPGEAQKAKDNLDKAVREAAALSEAERQNRAEKAAKARLKNREQLQHVPDAFDFTLVAETVIGERPAWQIHASPRREYKGPDASLFHNMEGTLWIDQQDYQWVKVEADALDTISFGWFLARVAKGTRISFENFRVNDEMWAPKRVTLHATARLALLKKVNADQETTFSDYRKFQSDSRIVPTETPSK